MSHRLSLRQYCALSQVLVRWRLWPRLMAAIVVCLTSVSLAPAQAPDPADKPAVAKDQPAKEPQVRDRDKLLAEHQRLLDEENKLASEHKYAEAIKTSQQRESVLLEQAKLPDLKSAANQMRLDVLMARGNWQWLSGQIAAAEQTSEQRLQLSEVDFGVEHWRSASARCSLDYYRKLAATDEPTRQRMRELEQQANAADAKELIQELIRELDSLR